MRTEEGVHRDALESAPHRVRISRLVLNFFGTAAGDIPGVDSMRRPVKLSWESSVPFPELLLRSHGASCPARQLGCRA